MEVKYVYTDALSEATHRTEMEAITMPQSIEGAPSSGARAVLGIMDARDAVFVRSTMARAASEIFPSLRIALNKENGLTIEDEGSSNGVVFSFKDDRIKPNDAVVVGVNLKTAILYYILFEWFTMFPQRTDIAKKYHDLFLNSISGLKRSIIQL